MYAAIGYRPASRQRLALGAGPYRRHSRPSCTRAARRPSRYGSYEDGLTASQAHVHLRRTCASTYRIVPLDMSQPTYMRGPGARPARSPSSAAIDDLAYRLRMDPIELRLRNEPDRDQTDRTAVLDPAARPSACVRAPTTFGWSRRNPTPRAVRDGDRLIGIGHGRGRAITRSRSPCGVWRGSNADGTADVFSRGTSDMGPGTYTSMTQVAADALGPAHGAGSASRSVTASYPEGGRRSPAPQPWPASDPAVVHGGKYAAGPADSHGGHGPEARRSAGWRPEDVAVADGRMHVIADPSRGETYQDLLRRRGLPSLDASQT